MYDAALDIKPDPRIFYNKAVTYYKQSDYPNCLKTLGALVDLAAKMYPEMVEAAQSFTADGMAEQVSQI